MVQWQIESGQRKLAPFAENDVCCQITPISFVASLFETVGTLCMGRRLLAVSHAVAPDPDL